MCTGINFDGISSGTYTKYHLHIHFDLAYNYNTLQCGLHCWDRIINFCFRYHKYINIITDPRY